SVEAVAFGGSAPCDWRDDFERFADAGVETLIVSFAGNDNTPCVNPTGGGFRDPQTIADAYAVMVPELLDLYAGTGTDIYLAVPPPVGPPASEPAAAAIRTVYRDIADDREDVTIVDPGPALGPDGGFHVALPCESWEADVCGPDGTVTVRNADGIHLTPAGGERYARVLLEAIGHPVAG
ncbi:MAG TPA: GDSL-type esterase/lipase family protein, partial [Acidimicrobiales bacterium]|nr:GDSL-type esterase/lipase family protein [Acidimicrobiales bacterium]